MNKDEKTLKDSIETLNYLLTQVIVELKQLNSTLLDLGLIQANRQVIGKTEKKTKRKEGFKGNEEQLERYIKQKCPTLYKHLEEIYRMKSGDFLITFGYVKGNEYQKMAEEVKEALGGYYSKKYRGFIIPGEGGGRE